MIKDNLVSLVVLTSQRVYPVQAESSASPGQGASTKTTAHKEHMPVEQAQYVISVELESTVAKLRKLQKQHVLVVVLEDTTIKLDRFQIQIAKRAKKASTTTN